MIKVAVEQSMMMAITQAAIEATKAANVVVSKAEGPAQNRRAVHTVSKTEWSIMERANLPTGGQQIKYNELINFEMEVRIIFMIKMKMWQ